LNRITCKIVKQKYDITVVSEISVNASSITRGNNYKLLNQTFHYDLQKYLFTPRIVNWSSLPNEVVGVDTTNTVKNKVDKF